MVKKIELETEQEDFQDDFGFDFDQFSSTPPPPPTGREAVKVGVTAAFRGVKGAVTEQSNIERLVRDTLPQGYGEAYDYFNENKNNLKDVWREVIEQVRPVKNQLMDLTKRMIPDLKGFLPDGLLNKLDKLASREEDEWDSASERSDPVQTTLGEIFKQQTINQEQLEEREDKQRQFDRSFEHLRHQKVSKFLHGIWENTTRVAEYQDNILVNYQRKTLEIQMQQYGVIGDQYALTKQLSTALVEKLDKIIFHTGLPDYKKMHLSEAAHENLRDSVLTKAREAFFADSTSFVTNFFGKLGKKVRQTVNTATEGVKTGMSFAGGVDFDDGFGEPEDSVTKQSKKLGKFLAEMGLGKLAKLGNKTVGRNQKVSGVGEELLYKVKNAGATFKDWLLDKKDESFVDSIRHAAAEYGEANAPLGKNDSKYKVEGTADLDKGKGFTGLDSTAIREVIPGYLASILKEVQSIRTGKDAPLMKYDYDGGKFVSSEQLKKNIVNRLMGNNRQMVDETFEKMFSKVDLGGRLDEGVRGKAKKILFKYIQNGGNTSIEKLLDPEVWKDLSPKESKQVMEVLNRYVRTDKGGRRYMGKQNVKRQDYLTSTLNGIKRSFASPDEKIQSLINTGNREELLASGLITENNTLSREKVTQIIGMSDDEYRQEYGYGRVKREEKKKNKTAMERMLDRAAKEAKEAKNKISDTILGADDTGPGSGPPKTFVQKMLDLVGLGGAKEKIADVKKSALESIHKASGAARNNPQVKALIENAEKAIGKINSVEQVEAITKYFNDKIERANNFRESTGLESIKDLAERYKTSDDLGPISDVDPNDLIPPPAPVPPQVDEPNKNNREEIEQNVRLPRGPDDTPDAESKTSNLRRRQNDFLKEHSDKMGLYAEQIVSIQQKQLAQGESLYNHIVQTHNQDRLNEQQLFGLQSQQVHNSEKIVGLLEQLVLQKQEVPAVDDEQVEQDDLFSQQQLQQQRYQNEQRQRQTASSEKIAGLVEQILEKLSAESIAPAPLYNAPVPDENKEQLLRIEQQRQQQEQVSQFNSAQEAQKNTQKQFEDFSVKQDESLSNIANLIRESNTLLGTMREPLGEHVMQEKTMIELYSQEREEVTHLKAVVELLGKIQAAVEKGVGQTAEGANDSAQSGAAEEVANKPTLFQRIKNVFSRKKKDSSAEPAVKPGLWSRVKGRFTGASKKINAAAPEAQPKKRFKAIRNLFKVATTIKDVAAGAISGTSKLLFGTYGDVYVGDEKRPRMYARKIKAGEYFNKSDGSVIKSLENVNGDVIDADGNIVLSADEIEHAYVSGGVRKALSTIVSIVRTIGKYGTLPFVPRAVMGAFRAVGGVVNFIKNHTPAYDVYAKGDMEKPILYAELMRYGKYFDKDSGKPIKHPRDIDGEVVDAKGNIIVNLDHLKGGLVDLRGAPIRSGAARFIMGAIDGVFTGLNVLRKIGSGAMGLVGSLFGGAKGITGKFLKPFTDAFTTSKKTLTVLEKIYNLLDSRLAPAKKKIIGDLDGDGDRDGSIEDERDKKDKKKDKNNERGDDNKLGKDGKPLWMTKLGSMLGGLFGGSKKKNHDDDDGDDRSLLEKAGDVADIYDAANGDGGRGRRRGRRGGRGGGRPGLFRRGLNAVGRGLSSAGSGIMKYGRGALGLGALAAGAGAAGAGGAGAGAGAAAGAGAGAAGAGAAGAGAAGAGAAGAAAGASGAGLMSKMGKYGSTALKGAGRVLGPLGIALGLYSAYDDVKEGNYGSAALNVGLAGASGVGMMAAGSAAAGTAGAVGGLAGIAGTAASAIGALFTWPVALTVAAITGLAVGGYKLYKYLKKTKLEDMSRVRLAQYGFNDIDTATVEKVFLIEDTFAEHVSIDASGKISLNHDKVDKVGLLKELGITTKDQMEMFHKWYHGRFRPVLAANLLVLKGINDKNKSNVKLTNVNSELKAVDKIELLDKATANMESVHNAMISPLPGLLVTENELTVKNAVAIAKLKIDKDLTTEGKKPLSQDQTLTGIGAGAVSALIDGPKSSEEMLERYRKNSNLYKVVDKDGKEIEGTTEEKEKAIASGVAKVIATATIPADLVYRGGNRIDALSAIRYKAYGLQEMEAGKIRQLIVLEQVCEKNLEFRAGKAVIKGNTDDIMRLAAAEFGIGSTNGLEGRKWKEWFNYRFLTVYLVYVNTMCTIAKMQKPATAKLIITPLDQITIANQIIGAHGSNAQGANISVWKMMASPWADYELCDNPDVTKGNLEAIKALAKKVVLGEDTSSPTGEKGTKDTATSDKKAFNETVGANPHPDLITKLPFGKESKGSGLNTAGDVVLTGKTVNPIGDKMTIAGGTGANIDSISKPQGKGWSAVKDTIIGAGKASGVDPRLIAMIAGIESGFDPQSVNPKTQAAGLGNFMPKTWAGMKKYFKKYSIPENTSPFDARANALMIGELIKENAKAIKGSTGKDVTQVDAYMAHFLGAPDAARFFKYNDSDIGVERFATAASQNQDIFYKNPKTLTGPRTLGEIYQMFGDKMKKSLSRFGIADSDFAGHTNADSMDAGKTTTQTSSGAVTQNGDGTRSVGSVTIGQDGVARSEKPSSSGGVMPVSLNTPTGGTNAAVGGSATGVGASAPTTVVDASGPATAPGLNRSTDNAPDKVAVNPGIIASQVKGVMNVTLQREESKDHGTFGIMKLPDGTIFHTLELPWKNNERQRSCIPPGKYTAKRRQTTKFGMAYELGGVPARSGILIHAGTYAGDVTKGDGIKANSQGCILLGLNREINSGQPRLTNARAAVEALYQKTGFSTLIITILPSPGQMNSSAVAAIKDTNDIKGPTGNLPSSASLINPVASDAKKSSSKNVGTASAAAMVPLAIGNSTGTTNSSNPPMPDTGYGAGANNASGIIRANVQNANLAQSVAQPSNTVVQSDPVTNVVRATQPVATFSRSFNPTPQEIEANARNNSSQVITTGFSQVSLLLQKLVDGQVQSNKLLSDINAKDFSKSIDNAKEKAMKETTQPPDLPVPGSARTNPPRKSIPLPPNPIAMDRLV